MLNKHKILLALVLVGGLTFVGFLTSCKILEVEPEEKYEPSWESLKQHSRPVRKLGPFEIGHKSAA